MCLSQNLVLIYGVAAVGYDVAYETKEAHNISFRRTAHSRWMRATLMQARLHPELASQQLALAWTLTPLAPQTGGAS